MFLIYIPFLPDNCLLLPLRAFLLWWMCFLFNNYLLPFSGSFGISVCELQNGYAWVIFKRQKACSVCLLTEVAAWSFLKIIKCPSCIAINYIQVHSCRTLCIYKVGGEDGFQTRLLYACLQSPSLDTYV